MKTIKISEKQWGRGAGEGNGCLLDPDMGKMCCLGFVALAVGYKKVEITGEGMPVDLVDGDTPESKRMPELVRFSNGFPVNKVIGVKLAQINDDEGIDDDKRKARLIKTAAKAGFKFKFVR